MHMLRLGGNDLVGECAERVLHHFEIAVEMARTSEMR